MEVTLLSHTLNTKSALLEENLEFKAAAGAYNIDELQGIVECFVAGIGNKDSVGDIVLPGAFNDSLKKRKPRVVWGHDWNAPIGKVIDIYEVGPTDPRLPAKMRQAGIGGLYARVQFNLKSERGREAFNSVLFFGEEQEWSIGYKTLDSVFSQERQANLLKVLELFEVSPVLHGANQLTATVSIKSEQQAQVDSFAKSKWKTFDPQFAEMIQSKYPSIWKLGGNIKGNDQYRALKPVLARGGKATSEAEINALELREAWVARHHDDHLPAGVMAQIKWFAVGSRGEGYMKDVIRKEIAKLEADGKALDTSEFVDLMEDGDIEEKRAPSSDQIGEMLSAIGGRVPNPSNAAPDALPQERITGDILHGHGPRRGGLERLLRYWRPIMRKEGGFRRCRVILADHPELYPLDNICAWLHHETTGLWPNEGCHHPGMKNCRKKMKRIASSLYSDSEFNARMRKLGKSAYMELADFDGDGEITDADIAYANQVLKEFIDEHPDFMAAVADHANWEHVGEGMDGEPLSHDRMHAEPDADDFGGPSDGDDDNQGDCGCGCGCGGHPKDGWGYMTETSTGLNGRASGEMPEMPMGRRLRNKPKGSGCGCGGGKDAHDDEIQTKAGRVISANNMAKLRQALGMLQEVLNAGGDSFQMKELTVPALADEIKSLVEPIAEFYELDIKVSDFGVQIADFDNISAEAKSALGLALEHVSGDTAFVIIDVEPEQMMAVKTLIDDYAPDAAVVIDEENGLWLAVQAKSNDFVSGLTKRLAWSGIEVKGYGLGELEYDCGCN
jgi:HK97 family phage prohead protease